MTESVTLHSTWRHLIGGAVGAVLVATAGTYAVVTVGFRPVAAVIFVLGWALVAVVLFDVPVASTFTTEGVRRRMLLRRQLLRWQPGDALTRSRPARVRGEARLREGGLVLRRGRRRYLLIDKAESPDEFGAVVRILDVEGTPGAEIHFVAPAPPEDAPPTWLYRRRIWRSDGITDR